MAVLVRGEPQVRSGGDQHDEPFVFTTMRYDPELVKCAENTAVSCHQPCPFYMFEHHYTRIQVAKWSLETWIKDDMKQRTGLTTIAGSDSDDDRRQRTPSNPSEFLHGLLNAVDSWKRQSQEQNPESLRVKFRMYMSGKIKTEIFNPIPRISLSTMFPPAFGPPTDYSTCSWTIVLDTEATESTESTMIKTNDRSCYDRARADAGILSYTEQKEVLLYTRDGSVLDGSISTPYFYRNGAWITPTSSVGGQQGVTRRWALAKGLCTEGLVAKESLVHGEIVLLSNAVKGYYAAIYDAGTD